MKKILLIFLIIISTKVKAQDSLSYFNKKHIAPPRINANDASKHIGETRQVAGYIFKIETRKPKTYPDSALVVFHLNNDNKLDKDFIILIRISTKKDTAFINLIKKIRQNMNKPKDPGFAGYAAAGKIFLFEGKPAVMIKSGDLGFLDLKG